MILVQWVKRFSQEKYIMRKIRPMAALSESVIYEDQQISDNFPIKNGTRVNSNTTPALE